MDTIIPNEENLHQDSEEKSVYYFFDKDSKPVYKSKEVYKKEAVIRLFPFNVLRKSGQLTPKKIKVIEFRGWNTLEEIPKAFRKIVGYGFSSAEMKQFSGFIHRKFPEVEGLTVGINIQTRFSKKTITLNWGDLENILRGLKRDKKEYDKTRKLSLNNGVASVTTKISKIEKTLNAGELEKFLNSFDSLEKISANDVDSLTKIISDTPKSKFTTTSHIIKTKEKIDSIFLDDIISTFEKLIKVSPDDEEEWQKFFTKYTWTLNHLFPYEVILRKDKAYVGGKTIENSDGRIVDYLFESGFKDNFALLEIKTPKKDLLKKSAYREPEVFAVSDELSGGVNQCLDQKDSLLRNMGQNQQYFDPKTILVIGQKKNLTKEQAKCFELYRNSQKSVDVVTFDEIYSKLVSLHKVITQKGPTE